MLWWGPFFSLRGPCGFCFASDHWRHDDVLYFYPTDFSVSFFFCPLKSFKWMKIHGNILSYFVFLKKLSIYGCRPFPSCFSFLKSIWARADDR